MDDETGGHRDFHHDQQGVALPVHVQGRGVAISEDVRSGEAFLNGVPYALVDVESQGKGLGAWKLVVQGLSDLDATAVGDLLLACHYSAT